jgi:hypothetical protein
MSFSIFFFPHCISAAFRAILGHIVLVKKIVDLLLEFVNKNEPS